MIAGWLITFFFMKKFENKINDTKLDRRITGFLLDVFYFLILKYFLDMGKKCLISLRESGK